MSYLRTIGQFAAIAVLFTAVAALSNSPAYRALPAGDSIVVLTFVHSAVRAKCRRLTAEEIAKLAPNMRRVQDCPRGRRPLYVELDADGQPLLRSDLPPTGIAGDGPSRVYRRFVLPAGEHELAVRMRDSDGKGFDHERSGRVTLGPNQILVIDFRPEAGGFIFQ